jgi:arylsulfatase A-like enzyme
MLTRRGFVGAVGSLSAVRPQTARKPNFVFLIADDHAGYAMGCDGNRQAETPNLDRLAAEGTRFAANYCNSPVCTPSRQSFLTGQMPHTAGVTTLSTSLDPAKPTIAKQLKSAGYKTAVFGKMHLNRLGVPGLYGFDEMMTEREINAAWPRAASVPVPEGTAVKKLPWQPFKDPARIWLNADNLPYPRQKADMRSQYQLTKVDAYLDRNAGSPFALWVSFMEPHSPFDFPIGEAKFKGAEFKTPRVGPQDAWQIPLIFRDLSDADKQGINAAYYNSVRYLDQSIGAVLSMLQERGVYDHTYIVYMADHGYCLGHHGRFEKHCGYDQALRVPLLMRWPGRIRRGVVHDLTESVDVPHTILDMLGAPELPVRHGQSLRPYLEGRKPSSPRTHVFSEYLENEEGFVRTERHKFIYCSGKRERTDGYATDKPRPGRYVRLYDLKADPGEFTDIAPKNGPLVAKMKEMLVERFRSTHPDSEREPKGSVEDVLDWYLRPRDAKSNNA